MIHAYHQTNSNADFDRISAGGEILPALFRNSPEQVISRCKHDLDMIVSHLLEQSLLISEATVQAMKELSQEAAEEFRDIQANSMIKPFDTGSMTGLFCPELIAGDYANVFLSLQGWYGGDTPQDGFIFDAEDLITRGARVRPTDIGMDYEEHIRDLLTDPDITTEDAKTEVKTMFLTIQDAEMSGQKALEYVRGNPEHLAEVVWEGPLPIRWAKETWKRSGKSGKRSSRT